jgi:hypothetical protein
MTIYKVTGGAPFNDVQPGESFEADLDAELEARALERGSIEIVKGKPKTQQEEAGDA